MTATVSSQPAGCSETPSPALRGTPVPAPSAWWVLIAGVVGLIASVTLTVENFHALLNTSYVPSCDLNPILSCGSVMTTPQAAVFGFPNPVIGIVAFTAVVLTGVLAVAKVALPRWYWTTMAVATLLGVVFVHWLIFQSLYRIGELCPYCMVVWSITIPLLVVVMSIAFAPASAERRSAAAGMLHRWRWSITTLWFTAVILLIVARFWEYWSTVL